MDLLLYIQGGSWHGHAYYGDMVTSNSYQAHGYLKAQIIDYWSSMTSKYRVSFKSAQLFTILYRFVDNKLHYTNEVLPNGPNKAKHRKNRKPWLKTH